MKIYNEDLFIKAYNETCSEDPVHEIIGEISEPNIDDKIRDAVTPTGQFGSADRECIIAGLWLILVAITVFTFTIGGWLLLPIFAINALWRLTPWYKKKEYYITGDSMQDAAMTINLIVFVLSIPVAIVAVGLLIYWLWPVLIIFGFFKFLDDITCKCPH